MYSNGNTFIREILLSSNNRQWSSSGYRHLLDRLIHHHHPSFTDSDIRFAGPKIVSRRITVSHILSVNSIFQRRVTIWDNLNANDYDQRRLCLGPFSGRSSNLSSRLSGMLINPNCEFELNFVPIHTLGQWFQSLTMNNNEDQIVDDDDEDEVEQNNLSLTQIYQVNKAFDQALIDWLPEFNKCKSALDIHQLSKVFLSKKISSDRIHFCFFRMTILHKR